MGAIRNGHTMSEPASGSPLPPPVGTRVAIISCTLERAFNRARGFERTGYDTVTCGKPTSTRAFVAEAQPDAVVVDCANDMNALIATIALVRDVSSVPLLAIGAVGSVPELLRCLEAGADDYASPNASTDEADLRLRAILRRIALARTETNEDAPVHPRREAVFIGDLEIDTVSQSVRKGGKAVSLSPTEFRLLATLAERPGEVVPSRALIARVWGNEYADETHYLRLYVRYLRQKIEDDPSHPRYIVNRWGSGYALVTPSTAA